MDRMSKYIHRANRNRFCQHPKPYLDRFIPRRKETNHESANPGIISKYGSSLKTMTTGAVNQEITTLTENLQTACKCLKYVCQEKYGQENNNKILAFSSKPQITPGTPRPNKERPSARRYLPNSAQMILDLPGLIDDNYRTLLSWSGQNILAVGLSDEVYVLELLECKRYRSTVKPGSVTCLSWHPEGQILAVGTDLGDILICDTGANTKECVHPLRHKSGKVTALQWNSSGQILHGFHASGELSRTDVLSLSVTWVKLPLRHEPCASQLHQDNNKMVVSTRGGQILIWDIAEGKPIRDIQAHNAPIKALAWVPWKLHMLVSGSAGAEGCIKLWNTHSGELLYHVQTNNQVVSLVINDIHKELITGHSNGELRFWQLPTLQLLVRKAAHTGRVLQLVVSPDRSTLGSVGSEECLMLWQCFPGPSPASPTKTPPSKEQGPVREPTVMLSTLLGTTLR